MASRLNPYLAFKGDARQAMEFYKDVFGGELSVMSFGDMGGEAAAHADNPDQVMHALLEAPNGFTLMASDLPSDMERNVGNDISISVSGDDDRAIRGYWEKLTAAGEVTMPFEKQVWGDEFGMCTDKFGIAWMLNITRAQS